MILKELDSIPRPEAPAIPGITPRQRIMGKRLAAIHKMHISALDETKAMMDRVEAGEIHITDLAAKIDSLEMLANYRAFGNLCGRECEVLNFHHAYEDVHIFPMLLKKGADGLKRVVERLAVEHLAVHQFVEELATHVNAIRTQPGPKTFAAARSTFTQLYAFVRSHFQYEERSLEEAIGLYNIEF